MLVRGGSRDYGMCGRWESRACVVCREGGNLMVKFTACVGVMSPGPVMSVEGPSPLSSFCARGKSPEPVLCIGVESLGPMLCV